MDINEYHIDTKYMNPIDRYTCIINEDLYYDYNLLIMCKLLFKLSLPEPRQCISQTGVTSLILKRVLEVQGE